MRQRGERLAQIQEVEKQHQHIDRRSFKVLLREVFKNTMLYNRIYVKLAWNSTLKKKKKKIMASSPITSWQIEREKVETVIDLIFLGSKKSLDSDCSHEFKRSLLLRRKIITNLDSILKSRDITLSTKVFIVKAMVFPIVTYRCQSWTIKTTEYRRIDAFELQCWEDSWESLGQQGDQTSQS